VSRIRSGYLKYSVNCRIQGAGGFPVISFSLKIKIDNCKKNGDKRKN
jgi:hypothetical protein